MKLAVGSRLSVDMGKPFWSGSPAGKVRWLAWVFGVMEAVWLAGVVGVWLTLGPGSRVGVAWMGQGGSSGGRLGAGFI